MNYPDLRRDVLECFAEAQRLARHDCLSIDLLKVPRHGAPTLAYPARVIAIDGRVCLYCSKRSVRIVERFPLCESHALAREAVFRSSA